MSRIRIKTDNEVDDSLRVLNSYYTVESGLNPQSDGSYKEVHYTRSRRFEGMEDVNTPEYYKKSSSGVIINSPMTQVYYDYLQSPGLCAISTSVEINDVWIDYARGFQSHIFAEPTYMDFDFYYGGLNPSLGVIQNYSAEIDAERDVSLTSAWANVDESEALVMATIGELPETFAFLVSIYRRLIGILLLFRSKKLRLKAKLALKRMSSRDKATALSNGMADFWMEMRYAVRPLCFEMAQVVAILEKGPTPQRNTARGHHTGQSLDSSTVDNVVFNDNFGVPNRMSVHTKTSRFSSYRSGVLYECGMATESEKWLATLGMDQPLESLWELTKLSFALDWFINIGDLIASWTPDAYLTPLSAWTTERHHIVRDISASNFEFYDVGDTMSISVNSIDYPHQRAEHRVTIRTPSPDKPVYPHVSINLDTAKLVDLVVIARNIYRAL